MNFNDVIKTETYIELDGDNGYKMLMPTSSAIFVDDESNAISVKTIGSRKTIGLVISGSPVPPTPPVPQYRWVEIPGEYECSGTTKMSKEKKQVSYDEGSTWEDVSPLETRMGSRVIETESSDCGYVPPTPTIDGKWKATYSDGSVLSAQCDSTSKITLNEIPRENIVSAGIGNCVTEIDYSVFVNCSGLTSVTIPNSVTSIGDNVFDNCTSLSSITIPNSVRTIGGFTFIDCISLSSITIPSSVASVGDGFFTSTFSHIYDMTLTTVTCLAITPPTVDANDPASARIFPMLWENNVNNKIYVPAESVEAYKATDGWSRYADHIFPIP